MAEPRSGHARGTLRRLWALGLATVAIAGAANVPAQVQGSSDYLSRMDADRDGRVSLVEYQDWLSYAFDAMDRDGDGVLSASEQPGARGAPITRAAHRAQLAAAFLRQDADADGFLSARELAAPPR